MTEPGRKSPGLRPFTGLLEPAYRWRAGGDPATNYAQAIEHAEQAPTL